MKDPCYTLSPGACWCLLEHAENGDVRLDVKELSVSGARLFEPEVLPEKVYLDVVVELASGRRVSLYAKTVVEAIARDGVSEAAGASAVEHDSLDLVEQDKVEALAEEEVEKDAVDPESNDESTVSSEPSSVATAPEGRAVGDAEISAATGDASPEDVVDETIAPKGATITSAGALSSDTNSDEHEESVATQVRLEWIHSDPLGEDRLNDWLQRFVVPILEGSASSGDAAAPSTSEFSVESPEALLPITVPQLSEEDFATPVAPGPTASSAVPAATPEPESDGFSVLVMPDQVSSAPIADSIVATPTKSFRFSHMVKGDAPRSDRANLQQALKGSDVTKSLRLKAKMVRASELAARHDKVRVLNESTVKSFIDDAVSEAVEGLSRSLDDKERKRLLEEAEVGFKDRLEAFQAEKRGLEEQSNVLKSQLERAQALLEEERQRVVSADQFTVSDAGMIEIETRLQRLMRRAVVENGISAELADEMRRVVSTLLDEERDKISAKAQDAQSDQIALLERKVGRLSKTLEDAQRERDVAKQRAQALEQAGAQVRNVVASTLDSDANRERKLALLKDIFQQNKEIRTQIEARGHDADPGSDAKPAPQADAESATASDAPTDDTPAAEDVQDADTSSQLSGEEQKQSSREMTNAE